MGYWSPKARKAYRWRNAERIRQYARDRYKTNPDRVKAIVRKSLVRLDDVVYAAKSQPCMDCKQSFPACAMQFDHVRGEKMADIAVLRTRGNLQRLIEEIAKCDVVCANCHAIRTCLRDSRPKTRRCSHG